MDSEPYFAADLEPGPPLCREILTQTLSSWQGDVEADLAVVFDKLGCGLECFKKPSFAEVSCNGDGTGCLGLYKIQKGFTGFADSSTIDVKQMYPQLMVWRRKRGSRETRNTALERLLVKQS
ncbi:MAG: hypothetical protein JRD68_14830 [Deltaproteobacteria bacterium]|nr:hypothetical protein [Deltaproteobacteria bacterium]